MKNYICKKAIRKKKSKEKKNILSIIAKKS